MGNILDAMLREAIRKPKFSDEQDHKYTIKMMNGETITISKPEFEYQLRFVEDDSLEKK